MWKAPTWAAKKAGLELLWWGGNCGCWLNFSGRKEEDLAGLGRRSLYSQTRRSRTTPWGGGSEADQEEGGLDGAWFA